MRMSRSSIEDAFASQAVNAECKDVIRNLNYIRYSGTLDDGCVLYDTRLAAVAENLRKSSGGEVDITIHGNQFDVDISTSDFNVLPFSSVVDEVPMRSELMPLVLGEDAQGALSFLDLRIAGHVLICGDRGCGKTNLLKTFVISVREGSIEMGNVRFLLADLDGKADFEDDIHLMLRAIDGEVMHDVSTLLAKMEWLRENALKRIFAVRSENLDHMEELWMKEEIPCHPYIVLVIDGLEHIAYENRMDEFDAYLKGLAVKSDMTGIHVIATASTELPASGVLTRTVLDFFRTRICMQTEFESTSTRIVGCRSAANLKYPGEMICLSPGSGEPSRYQSCLY